MNGHGLESDIQQTVDEYVHGLLGEAERAYVEGRIRESTVWGAAHAEALRRLALLRAAPASEPDQGLIARTLERVREEGEARVRRRRIRGWGVVGAIAAAVLLFAGLNIYFASLAPSPLDLEVLGQDELAAGSAGSLRVRLSRGETGEGVAGAEVEITLRDRAGVAEVRLASFVTDGAGTGSPRFVLPEWAGGEYELRVSARSRGEVERVVSAVELKREWRVMLSTDKPVYQPGQTIRMRTLALAAATGRPVAGERVVFEVADPAGNIILRESSVTSEFGIASAECALADLLKEGAYAVRGRVGETESASSVEVKRYTLPKFRVGLELDAPFYEPGGVVRGTIGAGYYFGKPVVGGEAEVEIVPDSAGEFGEIARATVRLDGEGRGEFALRLPERLVGTVTDGGDAAVRVGVVVRDAAGQEVRASARRIVTTRPLRVTLVPESGELVEGVANEVFVFVTTADGEPAGARVSVEGLDRDLETGELGVASFTLEPDGPEVSLAVRATDAAGRSAGETVTLRTDDHSGAFVLRTDRAAYGAGETVVVSALGGGDSPVFVDVLADVMGRGQTIATARLEMKNGRGEAAIDLPPEATGALRLIAYRYNAQGFPVRRERAVFVRPAEELHVKVMGLEVAGGERAYRPGETASLTLAVRGVDGRPAPGAVSLAVVDEAVFGVLGGASPLEMRTRETESKLLEPVYAVYPWDPFEVEGGEDRAKLARAVGALSARETRSGRDEVMARLVEESYIPEDYLEVFESERLDELLARAEDWLPADVVAVLRGESEAAYSLRESSYPEKLRRVAAQKERWREVRNVILALGGVFAGVGVVIAVIVASVRAFGGGAVGCLLLCVLGLMLFAAMLPSLGKARASARQLKEDSMLRGIAQGIELAGIPERTGWRGSEATGARVREWFPETLLWRPELVTDDEGLVRIETPLADSITSWRISGGAITRDGRIGSIGADLRVFQPFFVDIDAPVALVRGDEAELPAVVYNYLDRTQRVTLRVADAGWFELLSDAERVVELDPGAVVKVGFRIRAREIGEQKFEVHARGVDAVGTLVEDAIRRAIAVDPEGERVERVVNGVLRDGAELRIEFPEAAVEGSERAVLKLYPSGFSQVLEGLEGIFERPYGCFEQTSSTTYPNILALEYLRKTGAGAPTVEATALQYIHLGYQRLLTFEVAGGGFDWFGNPPANRVLTAYGLMEFEDMARVRHVDGALIERTRRWLLECQNADGSWAPERREMHDGPAGAGGAQARLATTAYIAWAVFGGGDGETEAANRAAAYLRETAAASVDDPYTLGLVSLALLTCGDRDGAGMYLDRLVSLASGEADVAWWARPAESRTMFYGAGRSADVEATALAALALMEAGREPRLVRGALAWLAEQRDAYGTWGTTQATVLALRALVEGADRAGDSGERREIEVRVGGEVVRRVVVEPEQSDVMQVIDLGGLVGRGPAEVRVADVTGARTGYQLALTHHEVRAGGQAAGLEVGVEYVAREGAIGEWIGAAASVRNATGEPMPMVILDVAIPAGFEVDRAAWDAHAGAGRIARYEVTARSVIVYLRRIAAGETLRLDYRVRATMPVDVEAPGPAAWEYYKPEVKASGEAVRLRAGV